MASGSPCRTKIPPPGNEPPGKLKGTIFVFVLAAWEVTTGASRPWLIAFMESLVIGPRRVRNACSPGASENVVLVTLEFLATVGSVAVSVGLKVAADWMGGLLTSASRTLDC